MKRTISEEIQEFKRLIGEATTTTSSGAYEQPLGFNQPQPTSPCAQGWERPEAQGGAEIGMVDDDEEAMSVAFDELDDDEDEDGDGDDVFNSLQMFTETKNGLGWK